jgi:Protein of unknown function (DUF4232)
MYLPARVPRSIIKVLALACTAVLLPSAALAAPAMTAGPALASAHAAPHRCFTASLEVWLGLGPGGAALGSTFYPLEFSNITHHACLLSGSLSISALSASGKRIGKAAGGPKGHAIIVPPGGTAHAILQVGDAGLRHGCRLVTARGLRVLPPGRRRPAEIFGFSFQACRNRSISVLGPGPVRRGIGVPGLTRS